MKPLSNLLGFGIICLSVSGLSNSKVKLNKLESLQSFAIMDAIATVKNGISPVQEVGSKTNNYQFVICIGKKDPSNRLKKYLIENYKNIYWCSDDSNIVTPENYKKRKLLFSTR